MIAIDQNSAVNSLNESLVPSPYLIDGRTEQEWLYFLTEFSKLINFYNDTNTIEGNWNPFLLKDPVFLIASIANTNYKGLYKTYKNICAEIQKLALNESHGILNSKALNKLFDHITSIYKIIERWTHYMQNGNEKYDLKNYILHEVQNKLSIDFWAVQSFRQYLYTSPSKGTFIASAPYNDFISFNVHLWSINRDKRPFWEIFGYDTERNIQQALDKLTSFCLNILTQIGDRLFNFLETIIHHSSNEFKKLSLKKSKFPDTTLLRSFVNVLKIQQDQLNGISQKHLDFYYTAILKQTQLPAVADNVYLCAALAKNNSVFDVPAGTLFNGGLDAEKNPILFASQKDTTLNPAVITSVQTLNYQGQSSSLSYNSQTITKPAAIQKDDEGKIIGWPTFGEINPAAAPLYTGIAFASPILLLREGVRTITLTLEFDSKINLTELQEASYFLSTQKSWLKLELEPSAFQLNTTQPAVNSVTITIELAATETAIEAFLLNPDGLKADWPMFKIAFENVAAPNTPPKILSIAIEVDVTGVQTFQLYNDFGELNTKNPFPPFGPIPLLDSSFIIGNNEIFSKPINDFTIEIDWDKIPSNFETYYASYNTYLDALAAEAAAAASKAQAAEIAKTKNLLGKMAEKVKSMSKTSSSSSSNSSSKETFNNLGFTTGFSILQEKKWNVLPIKKVSKPDDAGTPPDTDLLICLFDDAIKNATLPFISDSKSYYKHQIVEPQQTADSKPDPNIQNQPLKFTDASTSGFIKMVLSGPQYGFGSELYANVVANIALQNGSLFNASKGQPVTKFVTSANVPFAPKIKNFSAVYNASVTYKFDGAAPAYPLQCFIYTPFKSYPIFDSENEDINVTAINTAIVGLSQTDLKNGLPLYPSFAYSGALFIELEQLICNSTLNLYFELARNTASITTSDSVQYFYLNDSGWNEIKALSDDTNQFKCSGIIELPIPADCNNNGDFMPGTNNWLSIVVSGNLNTYSKTTFLQTNGFMAQRAGTEFLADTQKPQLIAGTITKPMTAIPQIAALLQPFASFGGKAAENKTNKNQRVSNSIKTKNRAVSSSDYYTLIAENFDAVYYSKVVNKKSDNSCTVYLAKKVTEESDTNAYIPLVTSCIESEVQEFLKTATSPFANINVSNFNLEYVTVSAKIAVKSGFEQAYILNTVNLALKEYLSPWITSYTPQIEIGKPLLDSKVNTFIQNIEGVDTVDNISFSSYFINPATGLQTVCKQGKKKLQPYGQSTLLVSSPNHDITF